MLWVNVAGIILIGLIVWWFWLYSKPLASLPATSAQDLLVTVEDGVYQPARVSISEGQAVSLKFLRKDASPCAGMVLFSDLHISEELPVDKIKEIQLPALKAGTYPFTCQMQMYRGELVVNPKA
jgi:plastocyanin domain-containing protein